MNMKNAEKQICVICDKNIPKENLVVFCGKCGKQCEPELKKIGDDDHDVFGMYDAKSKCCQQDIIFHGSITCSDQCHLTFIDEMEKQFGKWKKVQDAETGKNYRVPIKYIIERGLKQKDLGNFPDW